VRYVKSLAAGVVTGALFVGWVMLRTFGPFVAQSQTIATSGSGGIGFTVYVMDIAFGVPAFLGFLVGFGWMFRRTSRLARTKLRS
jgi:hypothetical protein